MISLTIDGKKVEVPAGTTVLEAAQQLGITLPTLCHHPDLTPVGACRLCVVEVERMRTLPTACTLPVTEGMVVHTHVADSKAEPGTDKVVDLRRFVLSMLLSDHPIECMTCEMDGDCELQRWVYEYDVKWPEHSGARHSRPVDSDPNPVVLVDMNKCILCGRCVRACAEIQGRDVWNFSERGFDTLVVAGANQAMLDAGCESCGNCVAYCPVGALFDKPSKGWGRATYQTKVRTTCTYCGVGCQFDLNVRDGKITRVTSTPEAPVNG
ncbi:MAG: (2Fe-2S)-binding protein, partial [Anaerolineae bacterium]|nr:(2Fe-2S)-binding protein [Anaerolineae bacterium]